MQINHTSDQLRNFVSQLSCELQLAEPRCACILYARDRRRGAFYRQVESEFDVEAIRCDVLVRDMRRYLFDLLFGYQALIRVRDFQQLPGLFDRFSQLAVVSVFVLNADSAIQLLDFCKSKSGTVDDYVRLQPDHFSLLFADDSAEPDGRIPGLVSVGPNCPQALKFLVASHFAKPQTGYLAGC